MSNELERRFLIYSLILDGDSYKTLINDTEMKYIKFCNNICVYIYIFICYYKFIYYLYIIYIFIY